METLNKALADYRTAVRSTKYWEDNGYRGDNRLEDARARERDALRNLKRVVRDSARGRTL